MARGNGFNMSISCHIKPRGMTTLEISAYNTYVCNVGVNKLHLSLRPPFILLTIANISLLFVLLFWRKISLFTAKLLGRRKLRIIKLLVCINYFLKISLDPVLRVR